jgi:hypothetical protein
VAGLNERLDASERVFFHERVHPAIWLRPGAVLGIGLFAMLGAGGPAAVITILVGLIDLCGRALQATRIELMVTDRRILARTGIFRAREVTAAGAHAVELIQHGLARHLGFVFVRLTPAEGSALTVGFVPDPAALRQALEDAGPA